MLIGEYAHTIDAKGRVFVPARLREDLGERFILSKGLDNCLFVYSAEEWAALESRIRALPLSKGRQLQRFFFSGASEAEVDKQGRVLLPQNLRAYAGLERDAVIIGASTRAEIWDAKRWAEVNAAITPQTVEQAMEELGF